METLLIFAKEKIESKSEELRGVRIYDNLVRILDGERVSVSAFHMNIMLYICVLHDYTLFIYGQNPLGGSEEYVELGDFLRQNLGDGGTVIFFELVFNMDPFEEDNNFILDADDWMREYLIDAFKIDFLGLPGLKKCLESFKSREEVISYIKTHLLTLPLDMQSETAYRLATPGIQLLNRYIEENKS